MQKGTQYVRRLFAPRASLSAVPHLLLNVRRADQQTLSLSRSRDECVVADAFDVWRDVSHQSIGSLGVCASRHCIVLSVQERNLMALSVCVEYSV